MPNGNYIKFYRNILDWEWYHDINVCRLFVHLLLKANHTNQRWKGIDIKRGQHLTSRDKLASETTLSVQQVRTALNKLKSTNEITIESTKTYTLVTIVKYADYQDGENDSNQDTNQERNRIATNDQPTSNQQITTNKNDKKEKNDKNVKNERIYSALDQAIENFKEHRRKLRKPMTDHAVDLLKAKLDTLATTDEEKIALIENAIEKGWQGVYPMNDGKAAQKPDIPDEYRFGRKP